jgi:hypothetical protein
LIVLVSTLFGLLGSAAFVVWRRRRAMVRDADPDNYRAWQAFRDAWRWRR